MDRSKREQTQEEHWLRSLIRRILRRRKPEAPEDPYSYVPAPKKPRPSSNSAAAVAELPEE